MDLSVADLVVSMWRFHSSFLHVSATTLKENFLSPPKIGLCVTEIKCCLRADTQGALHWEGWTRVWMESCPGTKMLQEPRSQQIWCDRLGSSASITAPEKSSHRESEGRAGPSVRSRMLGSKVMSVYCCGTDGPGAQRIQILAPKFPV